MYLGEAYVRIQIGAKRSKPPVRSGTAHLNIGKPGHRHPAATCPRKAPRLNFGLEMTTSCLTQPDVRFENSFCGPGRPDWSLERQRGRRQVLSRLSDEPAKPAFQNGLSMLCARNPSRLRNTFDDHEVPLATVEKPDRNTVASAEKENGLASTKSSVGRKNPEKMLIMKEKEVI
ncbi:hypothetical protein EJ03DRAFT_81455 [Teratosphaeria nubilosa]|uniref:Uncharacterized protein n=1 Tax=Teratosphaeria nubilosa TaxID=161662 RepID=A0A6G1LBB0_9PEZI|nr:hypothetical protein EJ03DRAFT_81455 [Teratosphaeria nubilosa]